MSKIANYLRGHLLGEIDFRPDVRQAYINDAGVLSLAPEMIVAPDPAAIAHPQNGAFIMAVG